MDSVDTTLCLSFEPQAIRDHFSTDQGPLAGWVASATDDELRDVGYECLSGDVIYNAFRDSLRLAVEDRL